MVVILFSVMVVIHFATQLLFLLLFISSLLQQHVDCAAANNSTTIKVAVLPSSEEEGHHSRLRGRHYNQGRHHSFAIVQSANTINPDFDHATSIMRCYSQRHGGLYFQNVFSSERYQGMHFYTARWLSLLQRYWHTAEWLIGADTDVVPLGYGKNVMDYLRNVSEDVVLHVREDHELFSAVVAFRTTSIFSKQFLEAWIDLGRQKENTNHDNGDLLHLTLTYLNPKLADECRRHREAYEKEYILCFCRLFQQQLITQRGIPIKLFYPLEGFVRSFEGPREAPFQQSRCLDSDVFGHGYKLIGQYFDTKNSSTNDFYSCEAFDARPMLPRCYEDQLYLGPEETKTLAQHCCYWRYAGCMTEGKNSCRYSQRCVETSEGKSGIGVCWINAWTQREERVMTANGTSVVAVEDRAHSAKKPSDTCKLPPPKKWSLNAFLKEIKKNLP